MEKDEAGDVCELWEEYTFVILRDGRLEDFCRRYKAIDERLNDEVVMSVCILEVKSGVYGDVYNFGDLNHKEGVQMKWDNSGWVLLVALYTSLLSYCC